jgi:hypothetical protein
MRIIAEVINQVAPAHVEHRACGNECGTIRIVVRSIGKTPNLLNPLNTGD